MEGLLRWVFVIQIVSVSVITLSVVILVAYAIRTWEHLAALRRLLEALPPKPPASGADDVHVQPALSQLVADLSAVAGSLERIPAALEELKGSVPTQPATADTTWANQVANELKQFRVLWTAFYGGKHERLDAQFLADLQGSARAVGDNLIALTAARPESAERPSPSGLLSIVVALHELAELEVDLDAARSIDDFDELGGRIVSRIDTLR